MRGLGAPRFCAPEGHACRGCERARVVCTVPASALPACVRVCAVYLGCVVCPRCGLCTRAQRVCARCVCVCARRQLSVGVRVSRRAASRTAEAQPEMGSAGGEKLGGERIAGGGDTQGRGAGTPCHPLAGAGGARGCR